MLAKGFQISWSFSRWVLLMKKLMSPKIKLSIIVHGYLNLVPKLFGHFKNVEDKFLDSCNMLHCIILQLFEV